MWVLKYSQDSYPLQAHGVIGWILHAVCWPILAIGGILGAVRQVDGVD